MFVLQIRKVQVDSFHPGRRIPSCDLVMKRHSGADVEFFRVELEGAKEPFNYFSLECPPGNILYTVTSLNAARLNKY